MQPSAKFIASNPARLVSSFAKLSEMAISFDVRPASSNVSVMPFSTLAERIRPDGLVR